MWPFFADVMFPAFVTREFTPSAGRQNLCSSISRFSKRFVLYSDIYMPEMHNKLNKDTAQFK
jgi:hypothetical protein